MAKLRNSTPHWVRLPLSIAACFGAGIVGSIVTIPAIPVWYATLKKPLVAPPNWVFGPVWTILYVLMGTALWLVWESKGSAAHKDPGLKFFVTQLFLNALWPIIFFGLKNPLLALAELVLLWIAIYKTIEAFSPVSRAAAILLIPYLGWVSFAGFLNLTIVLLNK